VRPAASENPDIISQQKEEKKQNPNSKRQKRKRKEKEHRKAMKPSPHVSWWHRPPPGRDPEPTKAIATPLVTEIADVYGPDSGRAVS